MDLEKKNALPEADGPAQAIQMLRAIGMVHAKVGFFMNWTGTQAGEGFEYQLLAIAILITIVIAGPGRFAVGRFLPLPKAADKQRPIGVL